MILFVDETENEEYFIVAGLLIDSKLDVELAFKRFKKSISDFKVSDKFKMILYTEFKSVELDKRYQRIKKKMLSEITSIDHSIIYSCFIKKGTKFPQNLKEDMYIALLSKIVSSIDEDFSIVFDTFNKKDFEDRIADRMLSYVKVQTVMARDSQKERGLQFVDNICSAIRLNKSGIDNDGFFEIIKNSVKEV